MTMAGALSVNSVHPCVCLSVCMSVCYSFDQNFMKLGHIVKYHSVFFNFDNGLYHTISSGVIALC